jgi:hypothetical protein
VTVNKKVSFIKCTIHEIIETMLYGPWGCVLERIFRLKLNNFEINMSLALLVVII